MVAADKQKLIQILTNTFNEGELRTLAFDLNINLEELSGESKTSKVYEIVEFADRRSRLEDLAAYVKKLRPNQELVLDNNAVTNTNIGNVGIAGNASVGQSIRSNQMAGRNVHTENSQLVVIRQIREQLESLRHSLEICLEVAPEERELRYALDNVRKLQMDVSQVDLLQPKLLLHRLMDNQYILEKARNHKSSSGMFENEVQQARVTNSALVALARSLAKSI
jgi:hypothetical protein